MLRGKNVTPLVHGIYNNMSKTRSRARNTGHNELFMSLEHWDCLPHSYDINMKTSRTPYKVICRIDL